MQYILYSENFVRCSLLFNYEAMIFINREKASSTRMFSFQRKHRMFYNIKECDAFVILQSGQFK